MKRALVTGGSGGIGRSILETLLNRGYFVEFTHTGATEEKDFPRHPNLKSYSLNFENIEHIEFLRNEINGNPPDILINNAARYFYHESIENIEIDQFQITQRVNLIAPLFLSLAFAQSLSNLKRTGDVLNISSVSVKHGGSLHSLDYTLSKVALENSTLYLSKIFAPNNIRFNCIRLGVVKTNIHSKNPSKNLEERIRLVPNQRIIMPGEVSQLVISIIENQSPSLTGSIIDLSGGE